MVQHALYLVCEVKVAKEEPSQRGSLCEPPKFLRASGSHCSFISKESEDQSNTFKLLSFIVENDLGKRLVVSKSEDTFSNLIEWLGWIGIGQWWSYWEREKSEKLLGGRLDKIWFLTECGSEVEKRVWETEVFGLGNGEYLKRSAWRRGEDDDFSFGYTEFQMPRNHQSSNV